MSMLRTHYANNETGKVDLIHDSIHDASTTPPAVVGYSVVRTHDENTTCDYCIPKLVGDARLAPTAPPVAPNPTVTTTPTYYTGSGSMDVIDFMTPQVAPDQMEGFFRMNIMKYLTRYDRKGTPVQDLQKAQDYMNRLVKHVQNENPSK